MIRKFRTKDTDAVVATWRTASALAHPFLNAAFLDQEDANMRNIYLPHAETWVTEIDGSVIGFVALVGDEIAGLFLDPAFHGRRFGKAMVDKAVAEKGSLRVEVFEANTLGRRFYDAYGFKRTGEYLHEPSGQQTLRLAYSPG